MTKILNHESYYQMCLQIILTTQGGSLFQSKASNDHELLDKLRLLYNFNFSLTLTKIMLLRSIIICPIRLERYYISIFEMQSSVIWNNFYRIELNQY